MKEILGFIKQYYRDIHKPILVITTVFMAILVSLNYDKHLERWLIVDTGLPLPQVTARWLIYSSAFFFPYALLFIAGKMKASISTGFLVSLLLAPLILAVKAGMSTGYHFSDNTGWNHYWNEVIYWPARLLFIAGILFFLWRFVNREDSFYGIAPKKIKWKPYLLMLLIMVPLIALASTQPDFLSTYPKMKEVLPLPENAEPGWFYKLLYELSYGSDFISVEFFFRGFLVIGFMKWAGKDAILPMACFYCTIHFGKPMGECISSYFGGMLLGIVSYHTRSIYGGLMVHLGIAWLMELGGYIGNNIKW
jgi:hypothetical protein